MRIYILLATLLIPVFVANQSTCGNAVEAVEGLNIAPLSGSYYWYKYTMPTNSRLRISTTTNVRTKVYISCDSSNPYAFNDGLDVEV